MQRIYAILTFFLFYSIQLGAQNANCLNLYLTQADTSSWDTLRLDLRARNFGNAKGLQYTMKWDNQVLTLVDVSDLALPRLSRSNFSFNSTNFSRGLLSLSWNLQDSLALPTDSRLYTLKFVVKDKTRSRTRIEFVNAPVSSEVVYFGSSIPIPALIGMDLILRGSPRSNPLRINQVCSAISNCRDSLASAISSVSGGQPPYRYLWQGADQSYSTANLSSALPGTYVLSVLDARGDTARALVGVSPSLTGANGILLSTTTNCAIQAGSLRTTLRVANQGASGPVNFRWSNGFQQNGVNESSIQAHRDTLYSVTVSDANGCQRTLSALSVAGCFRDTIGIDTIGIDTTGQDTLILLGPNLAVQSVLTLPGTPFCTKVTASKLMNLSSLQFGLRWDPAILTLREVRYPNPLINANALGLSQAAQGQLQFIGLFNPVAVELKDALFEVCFTSRAIQDSTFIYFDQSLLPTIAVDTQQNIIPLRTLNSSIIFKPALWPGDADRNGIVDQFDLLPIGLAYGEEGTTRPNAAITWDLQSTERWDRKLINQTIDLAYVDADGNGLIDVQDTLALSRNWRRQHGDGLPKFSLPEIRSGGAPLFIKADTILSGAGQWFPIELGTVDAPGSNAYGLAFSIVYNPTEIKENELEFKIENSWLGNLGQNLIAFHRHTPAAGRIDVAITRIDGRNISGYGRIGKIKITIEDVILSLREGSGPKIRLGIENVRMISNYSELLPILPLLSTPVAKKSTLTRTYDPYLEARIRVFPQPAQQLLYIDYGTLPIRSMQLLQLDGRALSGVLSPQRSISLEGIPNGMYVLKVVADRGAILKKVIIAR